MSILIVGTGPAALAIYYAIWKQNLEVSIYKHPNHFGCLRYINKTFDITHDGITQKIPIFVVAEFSQYKFDYIIIATPTQFHLVN